METVVSLYKTPLIYGIMTMLFQFENGLEIQKTRIGAEVLRSGFYIDHTGDETPTTSQHSTVGFHRIGLPEIVVRGVSLDCAQQVLSGLYLAAQIGLAELTKGNHLEELFDREVHFNFARGARLPILVEDEQQLLRTAQCEDGDEAAAAARDDLVDRRGEALLAHVARVVDHRAVGRLDDEDMR